MSLKKPKFSVKIIGCKDLMRKGLTMTANPYVKLKLGQQPKRKTGVIDKTTNPVYNTWCDFPAWPKNDILVVSVWNFNTFTQNEFLGQLQFDFPKDPSGKTIVSQPLRPDAKNTEISGTIQLEIYDIEKHRAYMKAQKEKKNAPPADSALKATLEMMKAGDKWIYYDGDQPRECKLWYLESSSGLGSIVWTSRNGNPKAAMSSRHTLAISTLKKICVGDACPHAANTSEPDFCLTLQGTKVTHNLLGSSDKQRDDWLAGIKWILESRGKTVKNQVDDSAPAAAEKKDEAGKKKKNRRMTVEPSQAPQVHAQPATPTAAKIEAKPTEYVGEVNEQIKSMMEGVDVLKYDYDGSGTVGHSPYRLVFNKEGGKYGSLCWKSKTGGASAKLLLHECTDIYVGKQQDIFKGELAKNVENGSCLSIVDKNKVGLHIQFPSSDVLREWMIGVNKVLTSTGSKVLLEEDLESKAGETPSKLPPKKGGRKFDRHFSVAVKKVKPTNPDVQAMAQGAFFNRFRQKRSRADRSVKTEIFVFQSTLVNADGQVTNAAAEAGGLYWYEKASGAEENSKKKSQQWIAINSITDIFTGKQHDIFKNRSASDAIDERVMSIRGCLHTKKGQEQDFFLHLEAESAQQVETWVRALTHLLQLGGRVTTDQQVSAMEADDFLTAAFADVSTGVAPDSSASPPAGAAPAADGEDKKKALKKKRVSVVPPNWGKSAEEKEDDPFADLVGGATFQAPLDMGALQPQSRPENPFAEENDDPFADRDWNAFGGIAEEPEAKTDVLDSLMDDPFVNSGFSPVPKTSDPAPVAAPAPAAAAPAPAASGGGDDELARYLESIGLTSILPTLQKEEIDMESLRVFTPEDLKDIGLAAGPRVKIIRSLANWQG